MKKYIVVDDCISSKAAMYEETFDTMEEALAHAEGEWRSLSDHDKHIRDAYYMATAEVDEEDGIDYETIEVIKEFKA